MWASIVGALLSLFNSTTYGSQLEDYIVKHYPQNSADIDRLVNEFNRKVTQSW